MKIFSVIAILVALVACNYLCDLGKKGATTVSTKISEAWACDQALLYADFEKVLKGAGVCKEKAVDGKFVCKLSIDFILPLGKEAIATKYKCDVNKIDMEAAYKICDLIPSQL